MRFMYDAKYTRDFYNAYGALEWARLEATPYGRLQAIIHENFINRYIKKNDRVLDAGSGPGRFSITAARAGATVTVLDIF
jgi:2-polyprenyl-3-methyl-5-hydroxy-6-metoxy-1,4-benzoquinol methylase